jgi:ATP-dependent Clp protease ATP-binding subunit ClpA
MKEIERFFRPEFINRLDDVIVFRPLTKEDLVTIVDYETNNRDHKQRCREPRRVPVECTGPEDDTDDMGAQHRNKPEKDERPEDDVSSTC